MKLEMFNQYEDAQKALSMLDFMGQYSHDLKASWALLITRIEIDQAKLSNPTNTISLKEAYDNLKSLIQAEFPRTNHLIKTMTDILHGQRQKTMHALNLNALICETLGLFRGFGTSITPKLCPNLPYIYGDPTDLQILILNLIKNAKEACQEHGIRPELTLRTAYVNGKVLLSVKDNGPGLPDLLQRAFARNQGYFSTKRDGNGLGLRTVRRIASDHGAEVEIIVSEGGTCFLFCFSLSPDS